jgi:hypothetical protein
MISINNHGRAFDTTVSSSGHVDLDKGVINFVYVYYIIHDPWDHCMGFKIFLWTDLRELDKELDKELSQTEQ